MWKMLIRLTDGVLTTQWDALERETALYFNKHWEQENVEKICRIIR
jgi:hypothetical protein